VALVECIESGDIIGNVLLIEQSDGSYQAVIFKDEGTISTSDLDLTCFAEQTIRVTYTDPNYLNQISITEEIQSQITQAVYFVDANGDVIENLDEYQDSVFYVYAEAFSQNPNSIDQVTVTLKTPTGATRVITLTETGVITGEFISEAINFIFVAERESAGGALIVGEIDGETSFPVGGVTATLITVQSTTVDSLEIISAYIPVEKVWIIDGLDAVNDMPGPDGVADTIFIQFADPLKALPSEIFSIDWPSQNEDDYTATLYPEEDLSEISFLVNPDGTIDSSVVVVVLKDSDEIFTIGNTSADPTNPPTLILPDGRIFKGQEVIIEDRVAPVILGADRLPSNLEHYSYVDENGDTRFKLNPDSIVITFSEDISAISLSGQPWDSLVMFSATCNKDSGHILTTFNGQEPIVLEDDENGNPRWLFVISNEKGVYKPTSEGCVWLNPDALYADIANNTPSIYAVPPTGLDAEKVINDSYIFIPVEGIADDGSNSIANGYYTDSDVQTVQLWIPPIGMNDDGTINLDQQDCSQDLNLEEEEDYRQYPPNCLSTVLVESQGAYHAKFEIYDHLGKYLYSGEQIFGRCGEMQNENRLGPDGYRSWLVWNQKDIEGAFVGSGVYVWKVQYFSVIDETITIPRAIYKQGIARSDFPEKNCADN